MDKVAAKAKKPSKYRNKTTIVDGIAFASKKEADAYSVLKLRERAGEISHLELQPRFPLAVNDILVCTYVADFSYFDNTLKINVVLDTKGFRTRTYLIKRKLMRAIYAIEIVEA